MSIGALLDVKHNCDIAYNLLYCRGVESVIADYSPDSLKVVFRALLYGVSLGTFAGLIYLNYADVGICKAVQMIWALK